MPGMITIRDGYLRFPDRGQEAPLSAAEVYAVAFGEATAIRGVSVCREDLDATGLQFSEYLATATVVLAVGPPGHPLSLDCRLIATAPGFEATVPWDDGRCPDYAISGSDWRPLPGNTAEAAASFLRGADIEAFGSVSLSQYLHILQIRNPSLEIEDRTGNSLAAIRVAPGLHGEVPTGLAGTPYPYQLVGYRWLKFMCEAGLGGIIADEMGLGKTIQVICLILDHRDRGRVPCLVVCPATLLENWRREISRFAPGLTVCIHRGPERTGFPSDLRTIDVILTSYETAVADVALFRNITWDLLVIDEAQAIKNPDSRRSRQLKTLRRRCVVAMTGTPVENHLMDLWSITDLVVPDLLGTQAEFERRYPEEAGGAAALEPVLTPLILRRRVSEVATDLPPRIDIPQPLEMDDESALVYEALRQTVLGTGRPGLESIVKLRMFCTHPWIVDQFTHLSNAVQCSAKLARLLEILEEIVVSDQKALVFTSFKRSVDLLSREMTSAFGIFTCGIDGRTPVEARQQQVDHFSALRAPAALVLNPRAAGTGLNITSANHVIHYNLEWNPAVEDQASARAYRRGQTKPVTVHRFFYTDTVESVINDRMLRKRELATEAVVGIDGTDNDYQDILTALRVSPKSEVTGG